MFSYSSSLKLGHSSLINGVMSFDSVEIRNDSSSSALVELPVDTIFSAFFIGISEVRRFFS